MMTWYSIIQYCVPNNKWMMPMLNLMSGGSWHKVSSKMKCKKNWFRIERMKPPIEDIYLPSKKPFQFSNNTKPSSPLLEAKEVGYSGAIKDTQQEKP